MVFPKLLDGLNWFAYHAEKSILSANRERILGKVSCMTKWCKDVKSFLHYSVLAKVHDVELYMPYLKCKHRWTSLLNHK